LNGHYPRFACPSEFVKATSGKSDDDLEYPSRAAHAQRKKLSRAGCATEYNENLLEQLPRVTGVGSGDLDGIMCVRLQTHTPSSQSIAIGMVRWLYPLAQ
jgi:hypothetical protein